MERHVTETNPRILVLRRSTPRHVEALLAHHLASATLDPEQVFVYRGEKISRDKFLRRCAELLLERQRMREAWERGE